MRAAILTAMAVAAACGGSDGLGELLEDAGRALRDSGDAQAQDGAPGGLRVLEGACDKSYTERIENAGSVIETTTHYAEFQSDATEADVYAAVLCGYRYETTTPACPAGAKCSVVRGAMVPLNECSTAGGVAFDNGIIRVGCGTGQTYEPADNAPGGYKSSSRYATVRLFISP